MRDVPIPETVEEMRGQRAFFNAAELPAPQMKYVAWLDIMGTDSIMRRSMDITANFLAKLHTASLQVQASLSSPEEVQLHPVVDGVYITTPSQRALLTQLTRTLKKLGVTFICEVEPLHCFMVRGCVAFGPVWEARALSTPSHTTLAQHQGYANHILLGPCVTQAFNGERNAAPYGIWIHESARTFGPPGVHALTCTHWHWWKRSADTTARAIASALKEHLLAYLEWCKENSTYLMYEKDRIKAHTELVRQYFWTPAQEDALGPSEPYDECEEVMGEAMGDRHHI
jgi:hypothetical protein